MHRASGRCAETPFEDLMRIGPGYSVERVKTQPEATAEQIPDAVEVEDALHQLGVFRDRINHLKSHWAKRRWTEFVERDRSRVSSFVAADVLGVMEGGLGDLFGRRATVRNVVFNAEIAMR